MPKFFWIEEILFAAPFANILAMIVAAICTIIYMKTLNEGEKTSEAKKAILKSKKGAIITIAREHSSFGKQIGKPVAEKLGREDKE